MIASTRRSALPSSARTFCLMFDACQHAYAHLGLKEVIKAEMVNDVWLLGLSQLNLVENWNLKNGKGKRL